VLRNVNGLIAVYEVKDKRLKRVINYPEAFWYFDKLILKGWKLTKKQNERV
jgi:hypothetical protein